MLTESESQALINAAEQYAETKGGWTTARHASYATTDVPVTALSSDVQRSGLSLTAAHSTNVRHTARPGSPSPRLVTAPLGVWAFQNGIYCTASWCGAQYSSLVRF